MDKKHNPLTTAYPKFDKLLALFRKAFIINETTELQVDIHYVSEIVDVYIYPSKRSDKYVLTKTINAYGEKFNVDEISAVKYVFNHLLTKGSLPKSIPEFDSFQQTLNRINNIQNKTK